MTSGVGGYDTNPCRNLHHDIDRSTKTAFPISLFARLNPAVRPSPSIIGKGEVVAMVAASELYKIQIAIAPVTRAPWKAIRRDCVGTIDSLVELLQGCLAKGVMDRVCREGDGLFPAPKEIKFSCSCADWADMCKQVAAVLAAVLYEVLTPSPVCSRSRPDGAQALLESD